jgi:hypothetical protein
LLRQSQVDRVTPIQAIPLDSRHNAKIDRAALRRLLE